MPQREAPICKDEEMEQNSKQNIREELELVEEFFCERGYEITRLNDNVLRVKSFEVDSEHADVIVQDLPQDDSLRFIFEDDTRYTTRIAEIKDLVDRANIGQLKRRFSFDDDHALRLQSDIAYFEIRSCDLDELVGLLHSIYLAHRKLADAVARGTTVTQVMMWIRGLGQQ